MLEEIEQALDHVDDADAVVHHQHGAGAQPALDFGQGRVFDGGVQMLVQDEPHRGAAGLAGLEGMAFPDPAAVLVDKFPERHPQVGFDHAGVLHLAHHLHNLGAGGVLGAFGLVPFGAFDQDGRHRRQGFHVVDDGGLVPDPHLAGKRRLDPGIAPFALDGLDERGFLAADVRAAAGLHLDVEREPAALDVVAQKILGGGVLNGLVQPVHTEVIFAPDVDVADAGPHRIAGDGYAFQDPVGIAFHDVAVLDGAGLPFVGVAHDVLGEDGAGPGEGPLEPGGEAGAAPAPEARVFHRVHHFFRGHGQGLLEALVAALFQVGIQAHGIDLVHIGQEHQLIAARQVIAQRIGGAGQGPVVHGFAGPVVTDDVLDAFRGEASEDHLVDLHGRGDLADPQAGSVLQGEEAVGGGFPHLDPQFGLENFRQVFGPHDVAGRRLAHADDVLPPGRRREHGVKTHDPIEVSVGYIHALGYQLQGFQGQPVAADGLDGVQGGLQPPLDGFVPADGFLDGG